MQAVVAFSLPISSRTIRRSESQYSLLWSNKQFFAHYHKSGVCVCMYDDLSVYLYIKKYVYVIIYIVYSYALII